MFVACCVLSLSEIFIGSLFYSGECVEGFFSCYSGGCWIFVEYASVPEGVFAGDFSPFCFGVVGWFVGVRAGYEFVG